MKKIKPLIECHVYIPKSKKFNGGAIAWFLDNLKVYYGWVNVIDLEHEIHVTLPLEQGMKEEILRPIFAALSGNNI